MTQKEKLIKATMMAQRVKRIASTLRYEAKDYDVRFLLAYANELESIANEYLRIK